MTDHGRRLTDRPWAEYAPSELGEWIGETVAGMIADKVGEKDEAIGRLEHELDLAQARIDELTLTVRREEAV